MRGFAVLSVAVLSVISLGVGIASAGSRDRRVSPAEPSLSFSSGHPTGGTTAYANGAWSGYLLHGVKGSYQGISAEWYAPTLNCRVTPDSVVAIWVGVDGEVPNRHLFQTGIEEMCAHGTQINYACWANALDCRVPFMVSAGDLIAAEVLKVGNDEWRYKISDLTSKKTSTRRVSYRGPGASAEWIVEDPFESRSTRSTLAAFGTVRFQRPELSVLGDRWTDPPYSDALVLFRVYPALTGPLESVPSVFVGSGSGAGFSVSYEG